jgi:hypothetical protein
MDHPSWGLGKAHRPSRSFSLSLLALALSYPSFVPIGQQWLPFLVPCYLICITPWARVPIFMSVVIRPPIKFPDVRTCPGHPHH